MDLDHRERVVQTPVEAGVIDLGLGDPQPQLLPVEMLRRAAERRFADGRPDFLQYGSEAGDGYLRRGLAGFLSQGYGLEVDPESLFITSGASMGNCLRRWRAFTPRATCSQSVLSRKSWALGCGWAGCKPAQSGCVS